MTKDEFIATCINGGYCSKKVAEVYYQGKDNLTDNDLIEVYRIRDRKITVKELAIKNEKYHNVEGTKTTKFYKHTNC
jgi:hypothetical protein